MLEDRFWYIIRTKSNAEKKVLERLQLIGFEAFLPTFVTIRQWSDRKKKVEHPYIPGHVFVNSCLKSLVKVYEVNGVSRVLSEFGKPAVVRDLEIQNLRVLCQQSDLYGVETFSKLQTGEEVLIQSGPFKGLVGIVLEEARGKRINLLFASLGITVQVQADQLLVE